MPFNTPVLAMADGKVVGMFKNEMSRKGVEVVLRHTPEQTDLPFYHILSIPTSTNGHWTLKLVKV